MTNFGFTADYDSPRILVVVVQPGTLVHTTVQIFIVVVLPVTQVTTTVQNFIVDDDEEEEEEEEEDDEGAKMFFKIAQNQICISLEYIYT